jgi:hypothetical protein
MSRSKSKLSSLLHVACCMSHVVCHMLHVAYHILHACCMLHACLVACCMHAVCMLRSSHAYHVKGEFLTEVLKFSSKSDC